MGGGGARRAQGRHTAPFIRDTCSMTLQLGLQVLVAASASPTRKGLLSLAAQELELRERLSGSNGWLLGEWGAVRRVRTVRVSSPFLAC